MSAIKRTRADELLADRALQGLSGEEAAELASILAGEDDDSFDHAAAAVDLACAGRLAPMPHRLAADVERAAIESLGDPRHPTSMLRARSKPRRDRLRYAGWLAAAACFALAVAARLTRAPVPAPDALLGASVQASASASPTSPAGSLDDLRARVATSPDVVRIDWSPTKAPVGRGATGEVAWSTAAQRGYMRFRDLPPNDPSRSQYQLWIFDPSQDSATPIDGGVFDVPSGGDVTVPIAAKLRVTKPTLFAVTIEKPGGVVVSKREHIVLVAPVKT